MGDVGFDLFGVTADAGVAGIADRGIGVVDFLHHRANEAGEFRHVAREDGSAEFDVAENPVQRIFVLVIGRCGKESAGRLRPVIRCHHSERLLSLEVMEE